MRIGSAYLMPLETLEEEFPGRSTLGVKWHLLWGDTDE